MAVLPSELKPPLDAREPDLLPLENGDHLDQPTFHRRYQAMPEDTRAELIGGIVFMASPVTKPHRRHTNLANRWLGEYEDETPGVEALGEGTVILGEDDEPEPAASLQVLPEYGGRTREEDGYVVGAPELVVEVASSSSAIDLHLKRERYQAAGVDEYLVILIRKRQVVWWTASESGYVPLEAAEDGILKSRRFPGLWLDPAAFVAGKWKRVREIVRAGCASPEHAEFVRLLAERGPKAE